MEEVEKEGRKAKVGGEEPLCEKSGNGGHRQKSGPITRGQQGTFALAFAKPNHDQPNWVRRWSEPNHMQQGHAAGHKGIGLAPLHTGQKQRKP